MTGTVGGFSQRRAERAAAPRVRAWVTGAEGDGRERALGRVRAARAEHGLTSPATSW
ncbi:hypothetical protein [Streptomyces sp. NPDC051657]|uniref:hypothetical protein n=1 Tax=unclassified Streptomyces TaxID=2593676 RepID=UPI0034258C64